MRHPPGFEFLGSSPSATARQGTGAPPPLNPAVLSIILQLLLDD